ncbi:hypothetical protein EUTSA_v10025750mg [Eutrema salsugineum]|uniref:BHLH domain-containing protein n=1 Tax=Eutrema salsugineum TaxID=72664 RepID=V4ML40_EUTSA|nr:transcription factor bHLH77 isoform X2 [Eutrema salsugineum]ESQ56242.1 hypothetical protein EUTSA_v10025750mg [Eutrema salsugineum]
MDKETEETLNCLLPLGRFCDTQEITPLSLSHFSEDFPIRFPYPAQFGSNQVLGSQPTTQESNKSSLLDPDSVSDQDKTRHNSRKRKSIPTGNEKESPASSSLTASNSKISEEKACKRSKQNETEKSENKEEPRKDYIHVRARRGQATDSHSIAERARREKISERMKLLQDLVPGCNRITGKAVMLDEIINYVQSLQTQVEFLSMKLATINPITEFNANALLSAELGESLTQAISCSEARLPSEYLSLGKNIPRFFETQTQFLNSSSASNGGFVHAEAPVFWENDLQSIVQMGFRDIQQENTNCFEPTIHMKLEPER